MGVSDSLPWCSSCQSSQSSCSTCMERMVRTSEEVSSLPHTLVRFTFIQSLHRVYAPRGKPSLKLQAWGMGLKLLLGIVHVYYKRFHFFIESWLFFLFVKGRNPLTYSYQSSLPYLPLPSLKVCHWLWWLLQYQSPHIFFSRILHFTSL